MPTSPEQVRQAQQAVTVAAVAELSAVWATASSLPADEVAGLMTDVLMAVADDYGNAAGAIAADFYEELREAAGVPGTFSPTIAPLPGVERFESLAGWGAGPLFGSEPDADAALSRMSGGLSRVVQNVGRETVMDAVEADPVGVRYARHASANACAFCALMATRGAVYTSAANAGSVTKQGVVGEKYHDDCSCTVIPVFPGQEYEPAPYVKKWEEAYANAPGGADLKTALASMREELGTN